MLPTGPYIDASLHCGPYPFRPLPASTPDGLRSLMSEAKAEAAVVTPFPALFYTRGWEALEEWRTAFAGDPNVRFWAVIDPAFPGWEADLEAAAAAPEVAGVRLFPRYHGYPLSHPGLLDLAGRAARLNTPVGLAARLLDDRLHPRMLRVDPPFDLQEVSGLLKRASEVRWVLAGFYASELSALYPALEAAPAACVDIGCVKPPEFWWEDVVQRLSPDRLLLGTGAPLYYHAATRLSFYRSSLPEDVKTRILHDTPHRLFFPEGVHGAAEEERRIGRK